MREYKAFAHLVGDKWTVTVNGVEETFQGERLHEAARKAADFVDALAPGDFLFTLLPAQSEEAAAVAVVLRTGEWLGEAQRRAVALLTRSGHHVEDIAELVNMCSDHVKMCQAEEEDQ